MRCGILGPLLRDEFEKQLSRKGVEVLQGPVQIQPDAEAKQIEGEAGDIKDTARVGVISHIGGHKFAGNIIIYIPPGKKLADGSAHPFAGHGLWYGRVEPKHVEGLIEETIVKGNIVADMFRGGIDPQRRILRL